MKSGEILRDGAIGEAREALVMGERVIALRIRRWSDDGARAHWGEIYCARVTTIDKRRRGAFLDLGLRGEQGFLPLDAQGPAMLGGREKHKLVEGQGVIVSVERESARAKSPVLALREIGHDGEKPHRIARREEDEDLAGAKSADRFARDRIDEAIDGALARTSAIPGGGALIIEPSAALVAIDVDAGARQGSNDAEQFALDLNIAAAQEIARQVRLRALGGVMAIDFVSMRAKNHRAKLEEAVRAAFAGDPWGVQFGVLSKFGVFELARAQIQRPLHEVLCDGDRRMSAESIALKALRAIEREAQATSGRVIGCTVSNEVKAWLEGAPYDWRGQLQNRIGVRWSVEAGNVARDRIEVRAQ